MRVDIHLSATIRWKLNIFHLLHEHLFVWTINNENFTTCTAPVPPTLTAVASPKFLNVSVIPPTLQLDGSSTCWLLLSRQANLLDSKQLQYSELRDGGTSLLVSISKQFDIILKMSQFRQEQLKNLKIILIAAGPYIALMLFEEKLFLH